MLLKRKIRIGKAINWTGWGTPSLGWLTGQLMQLRRTSKRHERLLQNLRISFEPPITGSTNSRPISGTIKIGQTAPRNGCIKSRLRLTKDFLARTIVARLVGA